MSETLMFTQTVDGCSVRLFFGWGGGAGQRNVTA